ncbi:MAG: hypothetical protein WDN45_17265 [Caulobacteraceae bacterium]
MIANISASNIVIGKAETRRFLCRAQSARACAPISTPPPAGANPPPTWPGTGTA